MQSKCAIRKIYSKINTFDSKLGTFKSWSTRVVINESIMYQRKYWNSPEVSGLNLELLDYKEDSKAVSNLSLEDLTKVIQELPTGYRIVFNLYEVDGFSHQEIADKTGISVGTSKSQLYKAKALLKKKLQPKSIDQLKMIS